MANVIQRGRTAIVYGMFFVKRAEYLGGSCVNLLLLPRSILRVSDNIHQHVAGQRDKTEPLGHDVKIDKQEFYVIACSGQHP